VFHIMGRSITITRTVARHASDRGPGHNTNHRDDRKASGTQAIQRAAALLRALAKAGPEGATLAEVALAEALPRSTVHRMLRCLVDERLVAEPDTHKRYRLGELVHELSLAPSARGMDISHWRASVTAIAQRTGATAYLMRRSGVEAVCLMKADSQAVVRFVPVEVGQRRLLGVGAGATALLAAMEPAQADQIISIVSPSLRAYPRLTPAQVRAAVLQVRKTGFAISQGTVVADGFGMGIAIPDPSGTPHLALSLAAHASVVTESLITAWKSVLRQAVQAQG
jgi:DNA-binding IclR family transcriptional regulator